MLSTRTIATRLAEEVPLVCGASDSLAIWTHAVNQVLRQLAVEDGLTPRYKGEGGEFLLDFSAWRGEEGAELAAESEWLEGVSEILADFKKLMSFKSDVKVMIFCSTARGPSSSAIRSALLEALSLFKRHFPSERYLFVEFKYGDRVLAYEWSPEQGLEEILEERQFLRFTSRTASA